MSAPEGFVALDLVGFTDKGDYSAATTYMQNDLVHMNNAIWKCKIDNTTGITPSENANWMAFVKSETHFGGITATDTSGILGSAGMDVASQDLIDAIADRVMTKLLAKANVINNLLTTAEGFALDARQGAALKAITDKLNLDLEDKGQSSFVGVLKNRTNVPDLNNIKSVGCYYYAGSTGIANRPFDADGYAFYLIAFGSGTDSRICQLAVETGGKIANRAYIGNRWTNWSYSLINTDLINPYKTILLAWGIYADGTYTLPESIIGKRLCVNVGNSGRLSSTWTPSSQTNDIRSIVIPGGVIDIKILSATQVQITGTTPDYRVRDIVAI